MKRLFSFVSLALACSIVFIAGCDNSESEGPTANFQFQNYGHWQAELPVTIDTLLTDTMDTDTTVFTSTTSKVNIVVNGDTVFKRVPITRATGDPPVEAGTPLTIEARKFPGGGLITSLDQTFEEGFKYKLYTFGYGNDITPVVMRSELAEDDGGDDDGGLPALSGQATFRFFHGTPTTGPVDIYINRPVGVDSLAPNVDELSMIDTLDVTIIEDLSYLNFTDAFTYDVSRDPDTTIGNNLRMRITPANNPDSAAVVFDGTPGFGPGSNQDFIIFDREPHLDDDSLNIRLARKANATRIN